MNIGEMLKSLGANQKMLEAFQQAQQLAQNYRGDKQGMLQAINENGGVEKFQQAMQYVDNPIVASVLSRMGVNVNSLKQMANTLYPPASSSQNNLRERLNKLK